MNEKKTQSWDKKLDKNKRSSLLKLDFIYVVYFVHKYVCISRRNLQNSCARMSRLQTVKRKLYGHIEHIMI